MTSPEHRPNWGEFRAVMVERFRILVGKAPRDATDLWLLVCVLAVSVVAFYASILAHVI